MRPLPLSALLALAMLAASTVHATEWPQFHQDSLHTGVLPTDPNAPEENFQAPTQRWWSQSTGGPIEGSPVVSDGRVFVGSTDGKLYAFDAISGSPLWTFDAGGPISGTPALAGGVLYLVSNDGKLFALDAVTGKKRLSAGSGSPDPGASRTSPTLHEGRLFIGTEAGSVIAYSQQYLTKDWEFKISSEKVVDKVTYGTGNQSNEIMGCSLKERFPPVKPVYVRSSPTVFNAVDDNTVFFGSDWGALFAIDEFGRPGTNTNNNPMGRWTAPDLACPATFPADSLVDGYKYPTLGDSIRGSPVIDKRNNLVIVTSFDNTITAFDIDDGSPAWSKQLGSGSSDRSVSTPAVYNGKVFFGALNGRFYALQSAPTGYTDLWMFPNATKPAIDAIWSSPAYSNGLVAFGADDETLYILDAATGAVRFSARTGGDIRSSPAIWTGGLVGTPIKGGVLYVGGADGILYAFGGEKPPLPDLRVANITYPTDPLPLDADVELVVTVLNGGNSSSPTTELKLYVDNVLVNTQPVIPLGPGETQNLTYMWRVAQGNHTIRASVDPAGLSREFDRANNEMLSQTPAAQQPPPPAPPPGEQTAPPPPAKKKAPGPEGVLVALAVVGLALAARRRRA